MIKTLMKSIREYKKDSIITPLLVSVEVVMECIIPLVIAYLVREIQKGCGIETILIYGAILTVMAVISLIFGAWAGKTCATASCGFAKNLRKDMYYNIQDFSFENIDKYSTSSLVTRLTTDVTNVQFAYMMIIRTAIRCPLMLLFAFIMSFIMGGTMAFIFVIVIPILAFGLFYIMHLVTPLFEKVFKKYDNLNSSIQEDIKGIRVVKSFVREDFEKNKFDKTANEVCQDFTKAERIIAYNGPLMQFCLYAIMAFVLSYGSYVVITSNGLKFDVGKMSALLTYGFQILNSLMMISMIIVMISMSKESSKRIVEVLNEKSSLTNNENPIYEIKDGSIDFDNVNFKYFDDAKEYVLKNIDIHIKSGQTVGIIGGTGSSKTSLVNLISRLYDVKEGEVKVGGINVKEYDLTTLRNASAVVLQKNILFSGTIKENLRWGNENATDKELEDACKIAQADEFIKQFPKGYDTYIEQGGTNVSGGQKQRLCIARALLKNPKILIFDDSTSAVDTKTDALIQQGLKKYMPDVTKIVIAQRISSIKDSDMIIVMDKGIISGIGNHDKLLKENKIYQEVYYSQNKVGD